MLTARLLRPPGGHGDLVTRAMATSQAAAVRRRARKNGRDAGSAPPPRRRRSPPPLLPPRPFKRGAVSGWLTLDGSEHPLKPSDVPGATLNIMKTLRGAGHTAYLVGGAVRDALLGLPPKDFDVLTSAPADTVVALFARRARVVGARFPITLVRAGAGVTEVTSLDLFSVSGSGTAVTAADPVCPLTEAAALAASAAARDFTVNALFYDALSPAGLLHDPSGRGLADAAARVLRCCGAAGPAAVLRDDPARVLRAARLAARCSLRVTPATAAAAMEAVPLVASLPASRQQQEVAAALAAGAAGRTLALWRAWGLLRALLPELDAVADVAGVPTAGGTGGGAAKAQGGGAQTAAAQGGGAKTAAATPRAPRLSSLGAWAAVRALDAAASPADPAPSGVWMFAAAAPVVEARLKAPGGLAAAVDTAAARERDAPAPRPLTPALITQAAVDATLRDMVATSPRSLTQVGRRRAVAAAGNALRGDEGGHRRRRRPRANAAAGGGDGDGDDGRWDAVFDVALDWRDWVRREWKDA